MAIPATLRSVRLISVSAAQTPASPAEQQHQTLSPHNGRGSPAQSGHGRAGILVQILAGAGQMFGEIAFFAPSRKRSSSARCLSECTLLSIDEIAKQLGVSSGTVKTHSSRGRAALRDSAHLIEAGVLT